MPKPLKIELTITNKWLFFFVLVLVIAISIGVWAYTQAIPSPGHGGDAILVSINGQEKTLQQAINDGDLVAPIQQQIDQGLYDICYCIICREGDKHSTRGWACNKNGWATGTSDTGDTAPGCNLKIKLVPKGQPCSW